jgi:predicted nuclease of predicted toxin-antitoxin system
VRRFLVDEDLPRSTARALRDAGYLADDVRDVGLRGHSDAEIYERAQSIGATLVTADKGFGNIWQFPLGTHAGIVLSRVPDELPPARINQELLAALRDVNEDLAGLLVVVEVGRYRIRRPGSPTPHG